RPDEGRTGGDVPDEGAVVEAVALVDVERLPADVAERPVGGDGHAEDVVGELVREQHHHAAGDAEAAPAVVGVVDAADRRLADVVEGEAGAVVPAGGGARLRGPRL